MYGNLYRRDDSHLYSDNFFLHIRILCTFAILFLIA